MTRAPRSVARSRRSACEWRHSPCGLKSDSELDRLEGSMFDLWRVKAPGVEDASYRARLLCLRSYVDPAVAECADETWTALSRACHHHAYGLSPTAAELGTWLESVDEVVRVVAKRLA